MYKKAKKILALILTLSMVFSMLPLSYANEIEAQVGEETLAEEIQNTENIENTEVEEENQVLELTGEGGEEAALEEPNPEEHQEEANEAEEELAEPEFGEGADGNIGGVEIPEGASFFGLLFRNSERGEEIQPGDLSISKTATSSGDDKVWDIELTLTGKDLVQKTDIVLVMDTSGSMDEAGRMESAKEAAKGFVDKMIKEDGNTQIALVSFAGNAGIACNLTTNKDDLNSAIDGLTASGGTHTQAGIYQAEIILNGSKADNKVIVLLSDGKPTYSYDVKDGYKEHTELFYSILLVKHYETTDNLPYALVKHGESIGKGNDLRAFKEKEGIINQKQYYVNHGNMAIVEANEAKKNAAIYAIGLSLGATGKEVMKGISSEGNYYDASSDTLNEVYDKIGGKITYAAKNAKVTDPIGEKFDIVNSNNIQVVDKNGNEVTGAKVEWKKADNEHPSGHFTVTIPAVTEALSPIKIKYQVSIKNDADPGKLYKTNGTTTIEYTNSSDKPQTKEFKVPEVGLNAASIRIYELYVDDKGNLLKAGDSDFGEKAIDKNDNPISNELFEADGSNALALNKEYTVTAKPTVIKEINGVQKTFVLCEDFQSVKGTAQNSEISVTQSPYKKTFTEAGSEEVYFVYKLQTDAEYKVKHILQNEDGNYDENGAQTETLKGAVGEKTKAEPKTGGDYDYYIPQDITQQTIKADGSTVVEIKYKRRIVTFKVDDKTLVYNGDSQTIETYTHTAGEGVTFEGIKTKGKFRDVGTYTVSFEKELEKVTGNNGIKYFAKYENGTLTVKVKKVTLKADNKTKKYGENDPELTAKFTGLVDGELNSPTYEVSRETGEDVGAYTITAKVVKPNDNYEVETVNGTLTIEKNENAEDVIVVTAKSSEKEYDGKALTGIEVGYTYTGKLLDGHKLKVDLKGEQLNVGSSKNEVNSVKVLDANDNDVTANYNLGNHANGTLTVKAKKVTLKADDKTKKYGDEDPVLTVTFIGLVDGEPNPPTYKVSREAGEDVGAYTITAKVVKPNDNYEVTTEQGTLTITQASGSGGSGGSGGSDGGSGGSDYAEFKPEEDATIEEDKTPLGKLNTEDHFAYLTGYSDGTVKAKNYLTREEVAAVFFRLLDKQYREGIRSTESNFSDVNASRWSNKHISTLAKGKIISGYTDGTFKPGMKITRAELAAIASRFDKLEANEDHKFSDIKGHWAEKYIASAVKKGWVSGYEDGSFKPDQHITRAEFVVFVNNVLNRHVKIEDILAGAKEFGDLKDKSSWYYCPMKAATNSYLFKEEIEDKAHSLKYQKWTELISAAIEM